MQWLSMTEVIRELAKVLVKAPLNGWDGRVLIACSPGKVYMKLFTFSYIGLVFPYVGKSSPIYTEPFIRDFY